MPQRQAVASRHRLNVAHRHDVAALNAMPDGASLGADIAPLMRLLAERGKGAYAYAHPGGCGQPPRRGPWLITHCEHIDATDTDPPSTDAMG